jgi:hypothetical protein
MGVIYKLKEEVIFFVVNKKNEDPNISCRNLALICSEKFNTPISKSSINTLLKNSNLSSSVGRRPVSPLKKKFSIPIEKKKQLFDTIQKVSTSNVVLKSSTFKNQTVLKTLPPIVENKKEDKRDLPIKSELKKIFKTSEEDELVGSGDFFKKVNELRRQQEGEIGPVYPDMGFVFFKAAEWELFFQESFLGEFARRHIAGYFPLELNAIFESILTLEILGIQTPEQIERYQNEGVWLFLGLKEKPDVITLLSLLKETTVTPQALFDYKCEIAQHMLQAAQIKFYLEDGAIIIMDAQMRSFWLDSVSLSGLWPIHKSMAMLSQQIINNLELPVFMLGHQKSEFLYGFYDLFTVFEDLPGRQIKKICFISQSGDEIAEYNSIPKMKRHFIVGILPGVREFLPWIDDYPSGIKKPFYHIRVDKVVYYAEKVSTMCIHQATKSMASIRMISIWEENAKKPEVILVSNQLDLTSEEILSAYLLRWPNSRDFIWDNNLNKNEHFLE